MECVNRIDGIAASGGALGAGARNFPYSGFKFTRLGTGNTGRRQRAGIGRDAQAGHTLFRKKRAL